MCQVLNGVKSVGMCLLQPGGLQVLVSGVLLLKIGEAAVRNVSWCPCAWSGLSLWREGGFWLSYSVSVWPLFYQVLSLLAVLPCSLPQTLPLVWDRFLLAKWSSPALILALPQERCRIGVALPSVFPAIIGTLWGSDCSTCNSASSCTW